VLDKYGKPDDVPVGLLGRREQLPPQPLSGMYNKSGSKVRLTFKMELNQVWIGTKGLQHLTVRVSLCNYTVGHKNGVTLFSTITQAFLE